MLSTAPAFGVMTGTGDEVDRLRKGTPIEPADHHRPPGVDGDLRRPAAAGEANRRMLVGPHHRGVDVAEAVDLRAAQESHFDASVL